tara:strand:+ start:593 stop:1876 length:1284 start_codon:yes stop_codon:yes gene_type:complete
MTNTNSDEFYISVIGLGYVGLPLAIELAKKYKVIGYDIDKNKISNLSKGIDSNNEVPKHDFNQVAKNLHFTSDHEKISSTNFYIVTVPTPIDENNIPDLRHLESSSNLIGQYLKNNDIVVYESTVYPGCTEEFCSTILEKISGLKLNKDFYVGYSPERINPGDPNNTVRNISKVIAASSPTALNSMHKVYSSVVDAEIFSAATIKTAEMSKVIENTQRDINIALINEISIICRKMDINTNDVLEAAKTKWNFLNFKPGLVGGHCIGVDPYYLTHKSKEIGYEPKLILAGRELNDSFSTITSDEITSLFIKKFNFMPINALILGCTFKEDVSDVRNSKVFDIISSLEERNISVDCYDPIADKDIVKEHYNFNISNTLPSKKYSLIIIAVAHSQIKKEGISTINSLCEDNCILADLKGIFNKNEVDYQL